MKTRIKHILFLMCIVVSISQSIHILSHIFSSHSPSKTELVHINEHKCQLCSIHDNSLLPDLEFESFSWTELTQIQTSYYFQILHNNIVSIPYKSLRAPPISI